MWICFTFHSNDFSFANCVTDVLAGNGFMKLGYIQLLEQNI